VEINGESFNDAIMTLICESKKARHSIKYLFKEKLFGTKFAETYLFKNEK
jgi:hypothetical protein